MEIKDFSNVELMWKPSEDSGMQMRQFMQKIRKKYGVKIDDYWDLHRWSVENLSDLWEEIWDSCDLIYSKKYDQVLDLNTKFEDVPEWFKGARMNYAENILKYRDNEIALIIAGEDRETKKVTYAEMYKEACAYGAVLRKAGLKVGDRVACYMSNREESIYAMLGATSIGAIWSGSLPLLGAQAVLNRFRQTEPKILFTIDRFPHAEEENDLIQNLEEISHGLESLEKVVIVPSKAESLKRDISKIRNSCFLQEFLDTGKNPDGSVPPLEFEQLPFSHPLFISYTSGTTGAPKALVHHIGGFLSLKRDFCLHGDSNRDCCLLSISPVGWATWTAFVSSLASGGKVVIFEGIPYFLHPTSLWDMIDEFQITNLFLTPSVLDDLEKKGYLPSPMNHLSSIRAISSASSVVKPQNYEFVYKKIKPDVIFGSAYGSTELMGACLLFDRTLPIYKGEISAPSLGVDFDCFDDNGKSVIGELGEFVIKKPTPSLPLAIWGDKDGKKYKEAYFSSFPGVFAVGDLMIINPVTKGVIFYGRSDDTLKPKGTRFGSSEIYNVVDTIPEVLDSLCVSQYNKDRDERAVLFIKMKNGKNFSEDLVQTIRKAIERELSKKHVPEVIIETKNIPRNMNGKKMEIIVKKIINGLPYNAETVINPECLQDFHNIPELQTF